MSYTAILERGKKRILFNGSGQYYLAPEFVPPTIALAPSMATGTSASNYSDPQLVGERRQSQQVDIPFRLTASSTGHMARAMSDLNLFLRDAGDENTPTYFSWSADADFPYAPVWGQSVRRLKISQGSAGYGSMLGVSSLARHTVAGTLPDCTLSLNVMGIEGVPQDLAFVGGRIAEHTWGATNGISRGFYTCSDAPTNLCVNPSFETNTTGWTAEANATITRTSADSCSGSYCASVVATSDTLNAVSCAVSGAAVRTFTAWVKAEVGATMAMVAYNATDGSGGLVTLAATGEWQRISTTVTPTIAGASTFYVYRTSRGQFYLDAVQVEQLSYSTPFFDGDSLGCAWTSTAHASTSTALAGKAKIPFSKISANQGTIRVIVRALAAYTFGADQYLFNSDGAGDFTAWYEESDDKFYFSDATNSISTAAQSHAANTDIVLHFVWQSGSLKIYKNGAEAATGNTYTPYTGGTWLWVGMTSGGTNAWQGYFDDFTVYDTAATAANVLSDYNNIAPVLSAGKRYGSFPWLWTIDADGVIDDITDADQAAYGVAGGIDGDIETEPFCYLSVGTTLELYCGSCPLDSYVPWTQTYQAKTTSVTDSLALIATWVLSAAAVKALSLKPVALFVEINDAGTGTLSAYHNLTNAGYAAYVTSRTYVIDPSSVSSTVYGLPGLSMPMWFEFTENASSATINLYATRSLSGANNVIVTGALLFGKSSYIAKSSSSQAYMVLKGRKIFEIDATATYSVPLTWRGDSFSIEPSKINMVFFAMNEAPLPEWAPVTVSRMTYTPLYLNA